jgi:hypothetical protein
MNLGRTLLVIACALLLAACAAIKHTAIPYDNPRPLGIADCRGAALAEGDSCLTLVRANQWYSDSHLLLVLGASYCVSVPLGQRWFDLERVNEPPDGEPGSGMMNLYAPSKRFRDTSGLRPGETSSDRVRMDGWFALIAAVVQPSHGNSDDREELQQVSMGGARDCAIASVTGKRLKIEHPGELVFYPNDATLTASKKFFYQNNSGQVWVLITKMD